jgi:dihydroorotate dehydrogenase
MSYENHPLDPGQGVPLFIAPGVLKTPAQLEPFTRLEDPLSVPLIYIGGFTKPEWAGNAKSGQTDFIYYPERGMAGNARGLPNGGVEAIRALKEPIRQLSQVGIKTIIQITNLPHETPTEVIPELAYIAAEQEPTAVEVNLSCPNGLDEQGNLHPPTCNNPEVSAEVMAGSRSAVGQNVCLGAKDSPHVSSLEDSVDADAVARLVITIDPFIDFLTGINTIGGQPFPEIDCAGGKGGMSGPVVAPIAKSWLRVARAAASESVAILSCGGVDSSNAEIEVPERLGLNAIRVGGAQEFYRAAHPEQLAARWAIAAT